MTLNKKIKIQKQIEVGSGSFAKKEWKDKFECYARWINVHGSEVWAASAVQAVKPATVTVRFNPEIDEQCRIIYKNTPYEIVSIDNIRERNLFMEIKVKAVING